MVNSLQTRDAVVLGDRRWQLHRLDRLGVDHLPFTLKVLLENLLRHEDGQLVTAEQVAAVLGWDPTAERRDEVDLHLTRVFLHDTNGQHRVSGRVVEVDGDWVYPDVCLGTDSHTTMVNGLGVLGWGIGGVEAEAVMLGQSLSLVVPPVVGFRLTGELPPGPPPPTWCSPSPSGCAAVASSASSSSSTVPE